MGADLSQDSTLEQFTTFWLGKDLFGIEVMKVQEVTGNPKVIPVPLAPDFVCGLINLRGQIATGLGLRNLFGIPKELEERKEHMSVVCKVDSNLTSLLVDSIGDVLELESAQFEKVPDTMDVNTKKFLRGVYKLEKQIMCVVDLEKLGKELSNSLDLSEKIN